MNKILFIFLSLCLNTILFADGLTLTQKEKIYIAYDIGKNIKAKDGMTFENTLPSVMGQESSWGKYVIGDQISDTGKLKSLYDSSLGNFQIKLSTAKRVIKENPELLNKYHNLVYEGESIYSKFEYHKKEKDKYKRLLSEDGIKEYKNNLMLKNQDSENMKKINYFKSVINSKIWNERLKKGEPKAIATMRWAKQEYQNHLEIQSDLMEKIDNRILKDFNKAQEKFEYHRVEYNKLVKKARKDIYLINALLNNYNFSAEIAGYYLKMCYEEAINKGFKNPYKRAVGRYNGGWKNIRYYNLVKQRMKLVQKIIEKREK